MSATRIRSGITTTIRAQAAGTPSGAVQCPHQLHRSNTFTTPVFKWLLHPSTPTLLLVRPKARPFLGHTRFAHSSTSSKHAATAPKPNNGSTGTVSAWDIPVTPLRSTTSRDVRRSGNPGLLGAATTTVGPSTTASGASQLKDADSFIPEVALQDPNIDYWKVYQAQRDKKHKPTKTELLRLHDWLSTRPLMTNDIASRSTLLIKEMHKRGLRFNINLYNNLVHHHIKRSKFDDAQKVLDQMAEHREALKTDRTMRQRTLTLLLAMYLKSGDEARLQALVDQAPSSSSSEFEGKAFSQTMSEFLKWSKGLQLTNDSISRVKTIFHGIQEQKCSPNTPRFTHLLQRQFEDNRPQDAYRLINHILDIGFHPNAYTSSSIMSGLLNARLYDEAIHIWDRIKEDPEARSDQVLLNSLLSALCQDPTQFPTARELWSQILVNPEIKPDVITFSNMLNGYFRAKDPSSAMMLWDQMREKPYSIKPNAIMYNAVMTGLFHNHQPKEAMAIFDQMIAQKDLVLPLDTFQIMIKGLLSVRDGENLGKVLLMMEQVGVEKNAATYTIITDTLFSQRDAEAAKQVADLMTERKVAKNAITYSAIIAGLVNVGDFERAQQLFKEMQETGLEPTIHTFGAMMQGAFKAGDVELAESMAQLAKQNIKEGMSAGAYSIMISGYSSLLMMDKADRWFQEFRRAVIPASSTSSLPPPSLSSSSPLSTAISADGPKITWRIFYVQLKACVEHRLWAPADRVLRSMEELGFESNVPKLTRLIRRVEDIRVTHPEQFPSGSSPAARATTTTSSSSSSSSSTAA
ncbi:hypothetical protein BGZ96_010150 [Linnemannia gamsii]|uniref:Pentacotripeptide-repeat region of PRORP domain-containing protein n=1 Tax=Linnemannia gamsii TaxID=64522 RepID=A0ABQ7JVN9_9FUNG|nr:hypothetical protein BGZ96_010150 [Linnemannia gamsii]